MKKLLLLFAIAMLALISCTKGDEPSPEPVGDTTLYMAANGLTGFPEAIYDLQGHIIYQCPDETYSIMSLTSEGSDWYAVLKTDDGIFSVVKNGKTLTDTEYTYEYSTFLNPLHGFVLSMHPERGIIFDFEGIDGLSKNLPSRVVSSLNNRYEYSYTGSDRVTSIEKHEIADGSDMLHQYVDYTLDLEYVRLK